MSESTNPGGTLPSFRFLLDTDILIAALGEDPVVLDAIARSDEVFIPATALGELDYGAAHSARPEQNVDRVTSLAAGQVVLGTDDRTALEYGRLKADLRRRGRPIPDNDLWIAALAVQHDLTLATRDAHFAPVTDLRIVRWENA
ncbi:ribonuclease VapC [Gemmatimonadetes bacterium T265]|nr:ribonuclease VapC [Gemmatimonadetes bacterium T265]